MVLIAAAMLGPAVAGDRAVSSERYIAHVHRWTVTEMEPGMVAPPLTLAWERSPIWFWLERFNAGGLSESPGRRLADGPAGFVTVMKRTLYLLDNHNGRTLWSTRLPGEEILDWKLAGNIFLYSSVDYSQRRRLKGAIDVGQRKEVWAREDPVGELYRHDGLIPAHDVALYASDGDDRGINDDITAVAIETGTVRWRSRKDIDRNTSVPFTWFVFGDKTYIMLIPKEGGIALRNFALSDGRASARVHIFGSDRLDNLFHPVAIAPNGTLLIGYNTFDAPRRRKLIAFSLDQHKLLWHIDITRHVDLERVKHIVIDRTDEQPGLATIKPNRYLTFDIRSGTVIRDATPEGYVRWTEPNAMLYSYPYVFTSAWRRSGSRMAYDLIALNVATGKIEWTYEIDTESRPAGEAQAEILNFVVRDGHVYLARADGRIMAFRLPIAPKP